MAFVTLYALYLAALNVFLSTSLFDSVVNQDPVTIDIHYRRGWTLLPGRIHAEGLSIRSSDSNVEWILKLEEVDFDVSFLGLARQRFDVTRARGHGIDFRARQKLSIPPQSNDDIANLPPIEGYPAYSMRPAGPPSLERWFDEHYSLWTVRLDDVIAEDVREIWVDDGRVEGKARVAGGFYLKPIRDVQVGPCHVDLEPGSRVTLGRTTTLAPRVAGGVDLTISHFDPRTIEGSGVFRFMTLRTELAGGLADPATLPFPLPVYVSTEVDAPLIRLDIDRGVLRRGTRIELDAPRAVVSKSNVIGRTTLALLAEVAADDQGDRLRTTLDLRDLSVVTADATTIARADRLSVTTTAHALDLAEAPLRDAVSVVDLPNADIDDASVLNRFIPKDTRVRILSGNARAGARVELTPVDQKASGRGWVRAEEIDARVATVRLRQSFAIQASIGTYRIETSQAEDVHVSALVSRASVREERDRAKPKLAVDDLRIDAKAARLDFESPLRELAVTFASPKTRIHDITAKMPYMPRTEANVLRGALSFALDGEVTFENEVARGFVHARSHAARFELGDITATTSLDARARLHGLRPKGERFALDGATLNLRDVRIARKDKHASIDKITVNTRSPAFHLDDPLTRLDLDVALAGASVPDGAALDALLPKSADVRFAKGGSLDLQGKLSIERHVGRGHAQATAKAIGFFGKRLALEGDTEVDADIDRLDLDAKKLDLGPSSVAITNVHGRIGERQVSDITARRIELVGKGSDVTEPTLRNVDARLVIDDAELADARALQFLVPGPGALRINSGTARAFGSIALSSSTASAGGILEVDIMRGKVAIHETELSGDFAVRAMVRGFDPKTSTVSLSGSTLAMRDVRVVGAAAETRSWRGDAVLDEATLRLDGPKTETPRLDGILHLQADDARPLLGVLLRDALPSIVVGLVTMPRLTSYARLHLSPNVFLLSDVSASGGDVAVRGSYGRFGQDRQGAFIVEKGPISVGIGLDKGGAKPRFFNLDAWLGAHRFRAKAKAAAELKGGDVGK